MLDHHSIDVKIEEPQSTPTINIYKYPRPAERHWTSTYLQSHAAATARASSNTSEMRRHCRECRALDWSPSADTRRVRTRSVLFPTRMAGTLACSRATAAPASARLARSVRLNTATTQSTARAGSAASCACAAVARPRHSAAHLRGQLQHLQPGLLALQHDGHGGDPGHLCNTRSSHSAQHSPAQPAQPSPAQPSLGSPSGSCLEDSSFSLSAVLPAPGGPTRPTRYSGPSDMLHNDINNMCIKV